MTLEPTDLHLAILVAIMSTAEELKKPVKDDQMWNIFNKIMVTLEEMSPPAREGNLVLVQALVKDYEYFKQFYEADQAGNLEEQAEILKTSRIARANALLLMEQRVKEARWAGGVAV